MLKEVAIKYYKQGYNCSESILRAGNEVYDLGLHDKDMVMCAAFGAGFQIGDVCGALCGAACVISSRYVEMKAHDCEDLRPLTQKLVIAFQKKLGSRVCTQIKPNFFTPEMRCERTVATGAEVLESVIQEWDEK
ncbi:C-GCAxxG-C-C family (seleno)protein [Amedibacillus sp. YH-ame6]